MKDKEIDFRGIYEVQAKIANLKRKELVAVNAKVELLEELNGKLRESLIKIIDLNIENTCDGGESQIVYSET